jgi:Flp pilus assembly protein TadB
MQTEEITIHVDPGAAQAYRTAPDVVRRKLDLLLSIRLQDALRTGGSLQDLMREISRKAQERGLTAEILESILDEH